MAPFRTGGHLERLGFLCTHATSTNPGQRHRSTLHLPSCPHFLFFLFSLLFEPASFSSSTRTRPPNVHSFLPFVLFCFSHFLHSSSFSSLPLPPPLPFFALLFVSCSSAPRLSFSPFLPYFRSFVCLLPIFLLLLLFWLSSSPSFSVVLSQKGGGSGGEERESALSCNFLSHSGLFVCVSALPCRCGPWALAASSATLTFTSGSAA